MPFEDEIRRELEFRDGAARQRSLQESEKLLRRRRAGEEVAQRLQDTASYLATRVATEAVERRRTWRDRSARNPAGFHIAYRTTLTSDGQLFHDGGVVDVIHEMVASGYVSVGRWTFTDQNHRNTTELEVSQSHGWDTSSTHHPISQATATIALDYLAARSAGRPSR